MIFRIETQIDEALGKIDKRPDILRCQEYTGIEIAQHQRYYRLIYALGRDLKPTAYVELGVLHGWGLLHMLYANPDTAIIGVDLTFGDLKIPRNGLKLIEKDSIIAAQEDFSLGLIDMIMFDSEHMSEHLLDEFNAWDPLCRSGCIQLFDDIAVPHTFDAWDLLPEPKYEVHGLHPETGFGLRIKP